MTSWHESSPAESVPGVLPGSRAALVVATGRYADPVLPRLGAAARDAEEMAAVLGDPGIGAFEVTLVIDGGEREIRERAEGFLAGRGPDDLVVVYLSCHGLRDAQDRLYFAAADTRQERLASTGVESGWLLDRLDECRAASQVVILDCCFSGAFGAGARGGGMDLRLPERPAGDGRGRAVLTASRAAERSWEGDPAGGVAAPSVFTRALAEGLRTGAADADGDGCISVDDAFGYAYDEVIASGARQTPQRFVTGGEGTLWLARSPVRAVSGPAARPGTPGGPPGPGLPRGRRKVTGVRALGTSAAVTAAALLAMPITLHALTANAVRTPSPNAVRTLGPNATRTPSANAAPAPSAEAVSVHSGGSYGFDRPTAIAADGAYVWVVNAGDNSVTELSASDGSRLRILSATSYGFSHPVSIASDGTHIWVANEGDNSVTELNARDGSLVQTLTAHSYGFNNPAAIASDGTHVWVANGGGNSVTELNAGDGSLVQTLSNSSYGFNSPLGIASDGTHVWVANYYGDSVTELNAGDGNLVQTMSDSSFGFNNPLGIASDGTDVWVANYSADSVTELNAGDGNLVQTMSAASYGFDLPDALAVNGTHVWVANLDDAVTELNADGGSLVQTMSAARYQFDSLQGIAVDGTQVWVTDIGSDSVTELSAG